MPSGKQSKRRRAAAKAPPPPKRPAARRQASPRVLIAAAAVVALIIVAVVLGVVLLGGSDNGSSSTTVTKLPDATDVQQEFAGIPQHGDVLGKSNAPVTMIEYVDLQCPFCQQFETTAVPTLITRYVRKGKLRIEERLIGILGVDSLTGRDAALAAGLRNKLFNFTQLLYDNQGVENTGWLDDDMIQSAAASIPGLDVSRLLRDRNSSAVSAQAKALDAQKTADGVNSTPSVFVGKSATTATRVTLTSPSDETPVAAAIDAALG
jgi:protein-disulfide isomerase